MEGGEIYMKYMMFFFGGMPKDEDKEEHMKIWGAWIQKLQEEGVYESGHPYDMGGKVVKGPDKSVEDYTSTDGPAGHMIMTSDENKVIEVAKSAPNIALGGKIVIRPIMEMDMKH
jgi:hypothetical protein